MFNTTLLDLLAHPYDHKSFIVRPCHPVMEESVRLSPGEYSAAILPLLGTEQCSVQVSSAPTRGYAPATPMSIFGSLGVVNAGFKTLVAYFSLGGIEGAKILGNMGFEPQGEIFMVEGRIQGATSSKLRWMN